MRFVLRRLGKGDQDHELVFGVLFVTLATLAGWLITRYLPASLAPRCTLHAVTGMPCPTCGSYRALQLLGEGRVGAAWITQPFLTALVCAGWIYAVYAWIVVVLRLPRIRGTHVSRRAAWIVAGAVMSLGLANWVYLVVAGR